MNNPNSSNNDSRPRREAQVEHGGQEAQISDDRVVQEHNAEQSAKQAKGWRYTFSSLANRNFLLLWLGMLLTMGGVQMQMIAHGYLVYDISSSAFLLVLVNSGFALPMLSLSLFGGVIADRLDRKRIIQLGQISSGATALLIGLAITTGTVTWVHLFLTSMLQGVVFAFFMPARQAIIPQIVGEDMLTNAMALNAAAMSTSTLVAPAIAGSLYALIGPEAVYYVIGGMGIAAVVVTSFIHNPSKAPPKASAAMMGDIKAGLSYIRHSHLLLVLLVMGLVTSLLAMPFRFLMPIFVVDVYHRGPESFGLLLSIMGLGSLAGSLIIASLGKWRRGLLLIIGSFLTGIALMVVAVVPFYIVAVVIMVVLGLGDAGRMTLNQALIMEAVEDEYRGRVMSVHMMNMGLMPLGVLPIGIMAEFLGGQVAVGVLAAALLVVSALILITQRRLREIS